jgi:hypothetical protein
MALWLYFCSLPYFGCYLSLMKKDVFASKVAGLQQFSN